MKQVRVADLKAHLSAHLRGVRRGETLTVLDRDTPIARILPYHGSARSLTVRHALPGSPCPGRALLPPPLPIRTGITELLAEEREEK